MAEDQKTSKKPRKMQRLPKDYKVEKRLLLRPPIVSLYANASTPKVVYVSTKTPFMSAVKRVQKLLAQAEKRLVQSAADQVSKRPKYSNGGTDELTEIERVAATMAQNAKDAQDEVVLKATGKAITKALGLALWFQQRDEYRVRIETGTVAAIDDIVSPEDGDQPMLDDEAQDEIPESRIRYASTLQIFVSQVV